jgi:phage tail sheath protein FI
MKLHAIFAGMAGALLVTTIAGGANAQARYYPDGTNCSLLSDAELVPCQNQIYARQLESGVSQMEADPAEVQSSHIEGNEAGQSDFVPGSEGTEPPSAFGPVTPTVPYGLPGPEGTRVYGPTE